MPKGDKYTPGDLVFAKVKGYPPWPARVTGIASNNRYKVFFYGTHEIANIKNEDIWIFSPDNKAKFAPKNMKRKGYPEGLDQIENTPEIAAVDDDAGLGELNSTLETSAVATPPPPAQKKKSTETPASKKSAKTETPKTESKAAKSEQKVSKAAATPKAEPPPVKSTPRGEKRKAVAAALDAVSEKSAKKDESDKSAKKAAVDEPEDTTTAGKTSRSGRVIKPKKFGTETKPGSPAKNADSADNSITAEGDLKQKKVTVAKGKAGVEEKENKVFVKSASKLSVSVNAKTPEEEKAIKLEKRKNKLRWLKIEQRLVELDIAVKSSLHLETPSPDRCISALEELNELPVEPFMLKKQPDIVTTVRRLKKYIGPQSFSKWPDAEPRKKMEKSIQAIQKKADQIYNKFKSYFAYQGDKPFRLMFDEEVEEFKKITENLEESKVLSMIKDPCSDGGASDDE